jgi:hypothetical protein
MSQTGWKRAILLCCVVGLVAVLSSCGGGGSSSASSTSGLKKRALVTDAFHGRTVIVDAARDLLSTSATTGSGSSRMAESPDKKKTLVFVTSTNSIVLYDNATESLTAAIAIPASTESFVVAPDNNTVYVAVRNAPISGQPSGGVLVLDLTAQNVSATIAVPAARRVVLSHNGSKLLAFSDGSDSVTVVDTASKGKTVVGGFDRPVDGVFSSDDSKAYILSCGPECGGTTAQVTMLDMASNTPGASIPVSAATVGLLDSSNLYVAGTSAAGGQLDVINVSSFTVSKSGIAITDGYHYLMALGSNNRLFIGARTCSNLVNGCLSIFDTAGQTAVLSPPNGDVTGMEPIAGRNVVYVVEGGELVIYDTSTSAPQATQIDIVGQAFDVKMID